MFVCEPVAAARADLALLSGAAVTAAVTAAVKSQRAILRCEALIGLADSVVTFFDVLSSSIEFLRSSM